MRLILIIVVVLTLVLLMCNSGCLMPDELHIYREMTPMGALGTVQTLGVGVTYKLKK